VAERFHETKGIRVSRDRERIGNVTALLTAAEGIAQTEKMVSTCPREVFPINVEVPLG
jgi:hypothetical protein